MYQIHATTNSKMWSRQTYVEVICLEMACSVKSNGQVHKTETAKRADGKQMGNLATLISSIDFVTAINLWLEGKKALFLNGLFSQKCGPINHRFDLAWYPELQGNTVLLVLVTQREIKKWHNVSLFNDNHSGYSNCSLILWCVKKQHQWNSKCDSRAKWSSSYE